MKCDPYGRDYVMFVCFSGPVGAAVLSRTKCSCWKVKSNRLVRPLFFFFVHSVVYSTARVWYLKEERRRSQIYFRGRPEKKELQCSRWEVTKLSTIIATVCEMREGWRRWSCWKSADQIMLLMWFWKEKVFSRITLSLWEGETAAICKRITVNFRDFLTVIFEKI